MSCPEPLIARIVKALKLGPSTVRTLAVQLSSSPAFTRKCLHDLESRQVVNACGFEFTDVRKGGRQWVRYELTKHDGMH